MGGCGSVWLFLLANILFCFINLVCKLVILYFVKKSFLKRFESAKADCDKKKIKVLLSLSSYFPLFVVWATGYYERVWVFVRSRFSDWMMCKRLGKVLLRATSAHRAGAYAQFP